MEELTETAADRTTLQKLVEAGVALTSTQSVPSVLQSFVDLARDLVGARFAALGVLNSEGSALAEFYTSGISEQQRKRLFSLLLEYFSPSVIWRLQTLAANIKNIKIKFFS